MTSPVSLPGGCDSPDEVAEAPVLHLPSPGSPIMPVVQVRQFSWRFSGKHGLYDTKHRFGRNNKQTNSVILSPSSQAPLVSRVRLLRVIRKIGQQEKEKGEQFSVSVFKSLSKGERNVTSSSIPAERQRDDNVLYSDKYNAGMGINSPKHLCMNNKHFISDGKEQEGEVERENPSTGKLGSDDIIASSESDVTLPAVISVERLSSLVAGKRFLNTKDSVLSVIDNFRKRCMVIKGFLSLFVIRFITIFSVLSEITGIFRYGKEKSRIGNSIECAPRESLGNVRILSLFSNFLEYLNTILRFRKELWNNMIGNLVCKRNKRGTRKRKRIWSFASRPTLELRNLRLGNAVQETFRLRSGNTVETFMDTKHFPICLCLFLDLCASCRGQLGLFQENLKNRIRVKAIYVNIYLSIYVFYCALLSCKLAAYPGAFAIKMYTLVYFSPKVNLLERKYHHKNQSINLIGLAHVGKAYSRNRLFLGPNQPCWGELRPLVTPWVKSIKEGTDPWRNQNWALLSQCPGKLPSSLSLSPLLLSLSFVLVCFTITICL